MGKDKYPSPDRPISEWSQLTEAELKQEIQQRIVGFGMGGSTAHTRFIQEYHENIERSELKPKTDKILLELMDNIESGAGERAIYICSNLKLKGVKENLIKIIRKTDWLIETIRTSPISGNLGIFFQFMQEVNHAIVLLNLGEAKDFLIKQLEFLKQPEPQPPTREFYMYHLGLSALAVLKRINPEVARAYVKYAR